METQLLEKLEMPAAARHTRRFLAQGRYVPEGRYVAEERLLEEEDDRTLVAAAQNGRNEAFDILVHRYQQRILASALRLTRNRADAEDIVQQGFQKAFLHLSQFQGNSSFSTWLTRIVINEGLMLLRKKSSTVEVPIEQSIAENGATLTLDFPYSGPSPEDHYFQQEQKEILSAALKELTPGVRKAIELRDLEELSIKEASRKLGVSSTAIKARVFHGRKKLRRILENWMSRSKNLRAARNPATCLMESAAL